MPRVTSPVLLAIVGLAVVRCTPDNPIAGRWEMPRMVGSETGELRLDFGPEGVFGARIEGSAACTGSIDYTGLAWETDSNQLMITGTATCTGAITCPDATGDCTNVPGGDVALIGQHRYMFSDDDDMLMLDPGPSLRTFHHAH